MIAFDFVATLGAVALTGLALPATAPQDGVVATYEIGGAKRTLTQSTICLELARRHRNSAGGKEALEYLVELRLVELAAHQAGAMPTGAEIRAEVRSLETRLRGQKEDLDAVLARQRIARHDFEAKIGLGIAQQRLAAKVLKLEPEKVTQQHLALWTKEQRHKTAIVTDPKQLPAGVLARVGDHGEVTSLDVGRVLFTKVSKEQLADTVNRIVFEAVIAHEATRQGIEITSAEKETEYNRRKRAFAASGKNQGIAYEQWLEAFGSSRDAELESASLRTTVLHGKLVRKKYTTEFLDRCLAEDRAAVMRRHGVRRSMSILFIRATDTPNKILKRDFSTAKKHIEQIRSDIFVKKRSFTLMAKVTSDDAATKQSGGKVGWQHSEYLPGSRSQRVPDEVLKAAFAVDVGDISQPIKTKHGYYLVFVSGIEPEPDRSTLHNRMLSEMAERYNRELFDAAKIRIEIP